MKINIKTPRDISFEDINCGDVFYAYSGANCRDVFYAYSGVYMKIIPSSDIEYNAVNLSDGSLEYFDDGKLVNKLDSELNAKLELVVSE